MNQPCLLTIGEARDRVAQIDTVLPHVRDLAKACVLCAHRCGVNRLAGETGFCRTKDHSPESTRVASHTLHFGEEPPLVGRGGSGTVFFSHCNLRCVFCQNHQISQFGFGTVLSPRELADRFLDIQRLGAENLNLVTPTHYAVPVLSALRIAYSKGLRLPVVYNTNGYESLEYVKLLDEVVDIWLPDFKYAEEKPAERYSAAPGYPAAAREALREMFRQRGPLRLRHEVACSGVIIRHLVLPDNLAGSYDFLLWLKDEGMAEVTLGIMSQYSPQYRAMEFPELQASVSDKEYRDVVEFAMNLGFEHILAQGFESQETYLPDFRRDRPFREGT